MRRDTYIENDSGALSVLVHEAIDDIIEDQRENDLKFVTSFKALLLELHGDDSMPIRIVIDEPLRRDEEEQWLARASWRLDATSGRLVVMGGFDPDVLAWWKEATNGHSDARGVTLIEVPVGSLRVDLYAHVGSINGRQILSEGRERPGTAFRRAFPERPFPLWLASMLERLPAGDPGHETLWRNVRESVRTGQLAIDLASSPAIGFLLHVQKFSGTVGRAPESGWFARDANARVPAKFPLGLPSGVPDSETESFRDGLVGM